MGTELATGLFTLGGVIVGAGASTWGQVYLESKREKREADRAKRLVAGELLHLQLVLRAAAVGPEWPLVRDVNAHVPNAAWQEFRSRLVDTVDDDLFNQLVMTYAELEVTRAQFVTAFALVDKPLAASDATSLMHLSYKLGRLRRRLADTGVGWPDEIVEETVDSFMQIFDRLSDDDLHDEAQVARVKDIANSLAPLKHDGDAWLAEINRRLERVNPDQQQARRTLRFSSPRRRMRACPDRPADVASDETRRSAPAIGRRSVSPRSGRAGRCRRGLRLGCARRARRAPPACALGRSGACRSLALQRARRTL